MRRFSQRAGRLLKPITRTLTHLIAAEEEQACHLAVFSLTAGAFVFVSAALQLIFIGRLGIDTGIVLVVLLMLVALYAASRTRYHRWGAYIGLFAAFGVAVVNVLIYQSPISMAMFIGPILIAAILLGPAWIISVTLVASIGNGIWYFVQPGTNYEVGIMLFFLLLTGTMLALQVALKSQSQAALRTSERRYRSLFEQSKDAVFIIDLSGRHIEVNQRAADMLGYHPEEIAGLTTRDLVVPDQHSQTDNILQRLLAGEIIPPYERFFRRSDGSVIAGEVNVEIVRDAAGRPLHVQSIVRDISERKRIDKALRESEARQRAMLAAIPDMIFRIRADGTYLDYHVPSGREEFFPAELAVGRNIKDVLPGPLARVRQEKIAQALEADELVVYEMALPYDSGMRTFEVRIVPAGKDEVLLINRDVTELSEARYELERARARLEFSVDAARIAWWEMDVATGKVQFDPRKVVMIGYDPQDFSDATYHAFTDLVHPEDHAAMMQSMHDLLDGAASIYSVDYRIRTRSGGWMWFHDQGELAHTADGRTLVRGFVIDITERKEAQQREVELTLEKERVHLLSSFIQNASHEFRTPLTIISSSAHLLLRLEDEERRAQKAERIEAQVQRLNKLVDMQLAIAHLESIPTLARSPIDVGAICKTICQQAVYAYGDRPTIRYENGVRLPQVMGDVKYLRDALQHLLENAYRFTPQDGTITVASGVEAEQVWLEICDTGPGIAADILPRIFDTLWRQDDAHTTPGLGLGLPLARKIIERHGGQITLNSAEGEGTCVRLTLPALTEDD